MDATIEAVICFADGDGGACDGDAGVDAVVRRFGELPPHSDMKERTMNEALVNASAAFGRRGSKRCKGDNERYLPLLGRTMTAAGQLATRVRE